MCCLFRRIKPRSHRRCNCKLPTKWWRMKQVAASLKDWVYSYVCMYVSIYRYICIYIWWVVGGGRSFIDLIRCALNIYGHASCTGEQARGNVLNDTITLGLFSWPFLARGGIFKFLECFKLGFPSVDEGGLLGCVAVNSNICTKSKQPYRKIIDLLVPLACSSLREFLSVLHAKH